MEKEEIIVKLAEYFDIDPNEDGSYDITDSDWTTGCRFNGCTWLTLANVIDALTE